MTLEERLKDLCDSADRLYPSHIPTITTAQIRRALTSAKAQERNEALGVEGVPERMSFGFGPDGGMYFREGIVIDCTSSPGSFDNGKWKVVEVDLEKRMATVERIPE